MSNYVIMPQEDYIAACDAIREKTGANELITSAEMASQIAGIESGGTGSEEIKTCTLSIGTTNFKGLNGLYYKNNEFSLDGNPNATLENSRMIYRNLVLNSFMHIELDPDIMEVFACEISPSNLKYFFDYADNDPDGGIYGLIIQEAPEDEVIYIDFVSI